MESEHLNKNVNSFVIAYIFRQKQISTRITEFRPVVENAVSLKQILTFDFCSLSSTFPIRSQSLASHSTEGLYTWPISISDWLFHLSSIYWRVYKLMAVVLVKDFGFVVWSLFDIRFLNSSRTCEIHLLINIDSTALKQFWRNFIMRFIIPFNNGY